MIHPAGIALCLGILAACFACAEQEPKVETPTEEMISIMTALYLAEMPMGRVVNEAQDSIGRLIREKIAREHGMTGDELEALVAEIQLNHELHIMINDSVLQRLDILEKALDGARN